LEKTKQNKTMKSKTKKRSRKEMESENPNPDGNATELINSFIEITSSTQQEALFFLESHNFDLDAAVSSFLDNTATINNDDNTIPLNDTNTNVVSPSDSLSPDFQPSDSPSRSLSPSPSRAPYELRSRRSIGKKPSGSRQSGIRTLRDVKRDQDSHSGSDSDSDDPQEYYTGGQKR
jgi:UBX domain-containing protein 1